MEALSVAIQIPETPAHMHSSILLKKSVAPPNSCLQLFILRKPVSICPRPTVTGICSSVAVSQ